MSDRNVVPATFVLERDCTTPRALIFSAFCSFERKRQWFGGVQADGASLDFGGEPEASDLPRRIHLAASLIG